jgi:hypothetical protein
MCPEAAARDPPVTDLHVTRPFRPDDLYRFRIATDPRLSPNGSLAVFTVQTVAATKDGYRHALWVVPIDGDSPAPFELLLDRRKSFAKGRVIHCYSPDAFSFPRPRPFSRPANDGRAGA